MTRKRLPPKDEKRGLAMTLAKTRRGNDSERGEEVPRDDEKGGPRNGEKGKPGNDDSKDEKGGRFEVTGRQKGRQ